jgi:hypothetical protein
MAGDWHKVHGEPEKPLGLSGLPTAKDFMEKQFRKDLAAYRLGLRADELNIVSKLEEIRQAVTDGNLEFVNMALQYLIMGLKK